MSTDFLELCTMSGLSFSFIHDENFTVTILYVANNYTPLAIKNIFAMYVYETFKFVMHTWLKCYSKYCLGGGEKVLLT